MIAGTFKAISLSSIFFDRKCDIFFDRKHDIFFGRGLT
jgi:hypothetical protein